MNPTNIRIPQDYDQSSNAQQEQFFASLGLPVDLSAKSMQNFNYQGNETNSQKPNVEKSESQPFYSCMGGDSASKSQALLQQDSQSFRTALSQQREASNLADMISAHPLPQTAHHHQNYPTFFQDSAVKCSAPSILGKGQTNFSPALNTFYGTMSNEQVESPNNRELLTITVEIGNGETAPILIREGDNPYELAAEFCYNYGVGDELLDLLAEQIQMNIDQVLGVEAVPEISEAEYSQYYHQQDQQDFKQQPIQEYQPFPDTILSNFKPQDIINPVNDSRSYENINLTNQTFSSQRSKRKSMQPAGPMRSKPTISEASKKIMENKRVSKRNVHSRLHQQAVQKQKMHPKPPQPIHYQISHDNSDIFANAMPMGQLQMLQLNERQSNQKKLSTEQSEDSIPQMKPILNIGERLYHKGVKRREEVQRRIMEQKVLNEQEQEHQYEYKPQINDISKLYYRKEKTEDHLIKKGKEAKERIEMMRSEQLHNQINSCAFQPQITKKSASIMELKQVKYSTKFDNLYEDARRRQDRKDQIYAACIESECTFQPNRSATKYYASSVENNSSRLYEKRAEYSVHNEELFDEETGQPYFHPKVGRAPRGPRDASRVGDHLYSYKDKQQENLQNLKRDYESRKHTQSNTVFTQDNTNRIMERVKMKRFHEVFEQLDSDGDGKVSAAKIDISSLDPDTIEIMTPLFVEMEELGQALDEEEFIDACSRLYDSLMPHQKSQLCPRKRNYDRSKDVEEPNFQPKINSNSVRLAQKSNILGVDVATKLMNKKMETEQRIALKQIEKENSELVGCTFHPQIIQSPMTTDRTFQGRDPFQENYAVDMDYLAHNIAADILHL